MICSGHLLPRPSGLERATVSIAEGSDMPNWGKPQCIKLCLTGACGPADGDNRTLPSDARPGPSFPASDWPESRHSVERATTGRVQTHRLSSSPQRAHALLRRLPRTRAFDDARARHAHAHDQPRTNASRPRPIPQSQSSTHPRAIVYSRRGYRSGSDQPRSIPCSEHELPRGSYSGNFSQPGRYATSYQNRRAYSASHGGRSLRQTYPSDHYDEAGNYVGPPAVGSYSNNLVSFPRLPESGHSSPEIDQGNQGGLRPNSASETPNKRSFSEQLIDGVRGLLSTESKEDEVPPQPPRTGVYLFCRHYLIEECACITPLKDSGPGDYCQRCWEGRCDGPRPLGSVVRRSLW